MQTHVTSIALTMFDGELREMAMGAGVGVKRSNHPGAYAPPLLIQGGEIMKTICGRKAHVDP